VVLAAWAQVAAEFVNTPPRDTDRREKLVAVDDLERLVALCPAPSPRAAEGDLGPVRALRAPLLRAFEASTLDAFAAAVNPLLAPAGTGWQMAPDATLVVTGIGLIAATGLGMLASCRPCRSTSTVAWRATSASRSSSATPT
jgi:hypothetical protein